MAKHKQSPIRRVTTRSQSKLNQQQSNAMEGNQSFSQYKCPNKKAINKGKRKQKRRSMEYQEISVNNQLIQNKFNKNQPRKKKRSSNVVKNNPIQSKLAQNRKKKMLAKKMKMLCESVNKTVLNETRKVLKLQNNTQNEEMNPHDFHEERQIKVSNSPNGKSIQITCRNDINLSQERNELQEMEIIENWNEELTNRVEIPRSMQESWSERTTILNESFKDVQELENWNDKSTIVADSSQIDLKPDVDVKNEGNDNDQLILVESETVSNQKVSSQRLSLTTQCKMYLEQNKNEFKFTNKSSDEVIQESNENMITTPEDDVISIDVMYDFENTDDDVVCVSDVNCDSPSLIIIDDEEDKRLKSETKKSEIIDLTTPHKTPFETKNNPESKLEQSTQLNVFPSTSQNRELGLLQTPRFFPVKNSVILNPKSPEIEPNIRLSLNYNFQSNVYGNNFLNVGKIRTTGLRPIFIDGNNVAMLHSNGNFFSVEGLKMCIDYFKMRGHEVTAIVPQIRKKNNQSSNKKMLFKLEEDGSVIFTPSRVVNGRTIIPYDDRFIVQLAAVHKGIIVSCDNYKDLLRENPYLRDTIENRILNPTFVKDMIIFPSDPLGFRGPRLEEFLKFPSR